MKNKIFKQSLVDTLLQGRKLFWYGEETEIFLAKSLQHLEDEFKEGYYPHSDELGFEYCGEIKADWRYFWQPCLYEKGTDLLTGLPVTKGAPPYVPGVNYIHWNGSNMKQVSKFIGYKWLFADPDTYICKVGGRSFAMNKTDIEHKNYYFEVLPLICGIYGGHDDVAQLSTSYN